MGKEEPGSSSNLSYSFCKKLISTLNLLFSTCNLLVCFRSLLSVPVVIFTYQHMHSFSEFLFWAVHFCSTSKLCHSFFDEADHHLPM